MTKAKGRGKIKYFLRDSSGSGLITVLVCVSFMLILASIMMAVSLANVRMKQIEYQAKTVFYEDEKTLDDVYNGLGRDVSLCVSKAYSETLTQVTSEDGAARYGSQSAAYEQFVTLLKVKLEALFGANGDHKTETLNKLKAYVTDSGASGTIAEVIDYGSTVCELADGYLSRYIFKDVQVRFTRTDSGDASGYFESTITTDIVVEVPYVTFFQDFSRILDYSLVGNKGVYFKGADCVVEGNVYAGIDSESKNATYLGYRYTTDPVYDGMNFYRCNDVTFANNAYLISKGDINICESSVSVLAPAGKASTEVWAENIRTVENENPGGIIGDKDIPLNASTLNANANLHVANDLEINARESQVTLAGNYYGYNYNLIQAGTNHAYKTREKDNIEVLYEGTGEKASHTTSSAIMLNANHASINLTGLDTLVIAGLAYMDVKDPDSSYNSMVLAGDKAKEYQTGESLALRYNQMLYMAPAEILTTTNPARNGSLDVNTVCPPQGDEASLLADWFGNSYLVGSEPIEAVLYNYNGTDYVYYFLNFNGEADKAAYVEEVMNATEPPETASAYEKQKWQLKQDVLTKASRADMVSNVQIDGSGCKIYTKGLITNTSAGSKLVNTVTLPSVYKDSLRMANHYAYLYKRLDPANEYGLVEAGLSIADLDADIAANGLTEDELPVSYFVNLDHVITDESATVKGYDVIIKTNTGVVPEINSDVKGVIISKGDIVINSNVEGLVISGGKITVTTNGSIKANRGIVQTILENEQRELSGISEDKVDANLLRGYASYYFKQATLSDTLVSESNHRYINNEQRVTGMEYTDFIYYENWQKGTPAP